MTMSKLSRRAVLGGLATAGAAAAWPLVGSAGSEAQAADLGSLGAKAGIIFGASIGAEALSDPAYGALYGAETRIVTTDTALKFWTLRPTPEAIDFRAADAIITFAADRGLKVRGHTLIWNEFNPDWLKRCSAREVERIFDDHIERVVSRYAGRLHSWDVINEPFWPWHKKAGGYRSGPWFEALGPGYIRRALTRTRALDKTARLCINEAHCENENDWGNGIRPCLLRLVDELRDAGLPLDAIGLQCHLQPTCRTTTPVFASYIAELAARKVDIYITEFDVNDASFPGDIAARDQQVAVRASDFLAHILPIPEVKLLVTWQLADKYSFYHNEAVAKDPKATRLPRPLPFDDNMQPKPFRAAIAQAFDRRAV